MTAATMKQSKHALKPGEVCGYCELRAPPTKLCSNCRKEVPDWPVDEIGWLVNAGWEKQRDGGWLEPVAYVMRSPTPEMVSDALNQVGFYEAQLRHWKADKLKRADLQTGLEKCRDRLAKLKAGERFPARPRMLLNQDRAVQSEYARSHDYTHRTIDREVRAFTDEQCDTFESQQRNMRGGVLLEADQDMVHDRRTRTIIVHRQMCPDCRQY